MVSAFPYETAMTSKISMAYLDVEARKDNLLAKRGEKFPGQVFHFSKLKALAPLRFSWLLSDGTRTFDDGITQGMTLASYLHIHLWSKPKLAQNWIKKIVERGHLYEQN